MVRWIDPTEWQPETQPDPALGLSELLARLLAERGITGDDQIRAFLDPLFYTPTSALELPGVKGAVAELTAAIGDGRKIGVWGDFDVDGQTSTTLLVSALRKLGANVAYHIPVRATESHGIKIPYLDEFMQEGIELLLTCDTGVSAHAAIEHARRKGLRVVITDHHDLPEDLPEAEAVINPKMLADDHPLATLPGVGVAYKLMEALYQEFGREDELVEFLDLVALGLVADVASLVDDARYLLQLGLRQLRQSPRLGLQAIFERAELIPAMITEEDIGFGIAPRLNALGRLGDSNPIVEFLTTNSRANAEVTATMLEELNARRKMMSDQVFRGALSEIDRHPEYIKEGAIVLANNHWPPGVVGIVASRLADRYLKPVVLLKISEDGLARGSARSVPGCDISAAIQTCEDLLEGFGGHPMAAGMALKAENIGRFRKRLSIEVKEQLGDDIIEPEFVIDQYVTLGEIGFNLVKEIGRLAPYGNGNPPIRLAAKDLELVSDVFVGKNQDHRKLVVEDRSGGRQTVLWWQSGVLDKPVGRFDLAFTARESYFRGEPQIQVVLEAFRETGEKVVERGRQVDIVDLRDSAAPEIKLEDLLASERSIQVWGEGEISPELREKMAGRHNLEQAGVLAIWTIPPSRQMLVEGVETVGANKLFLFGNRPDTEEMGALLHRLAGLVKFVIARKEGETSIADLAVACGQTELVVQQGLAWMEAKGDIQVDIEEDSEVLIRAERSSRAELLSVEAIEQDLVFLLLEARLFRDYFLSGSIESLESNLAK